MEMTENEGRETMNNMQQTSPTGPEPGMLRFMVSALNPLATRAHETENTHPPTSLKYFV